MNEWDAKAGRLQEMGMDSEAQKTEVYSTEEIGRAIVYTRQDIVLVVSYLSSANKQLATIRGWLSFIAVVLLFIGVHIWTRH
jgi:hypothetical protein